MKLGNLQIKGKLLLAPMCDVTSLPFRVMCKNYGAAVVYTEMINADAYLMESERTKKRAYFSDSILPTLSRTMLSSFCSSISYFLSAFKLALLNSFSLNLPVP